MQLTNISSGNEQFEQGFRIFVDINEQRFRSAFTPTHVVKLTQPLYISNTNIYVSNGSVLGTPDVDLLIPGIVAINGERILYYGKEGNRLFRLRRGVGGTSTPSIHLAGSDVEDVGPIRYNNTDGVFTPESQYFVFPAAISVNEGNSIRFQINTVNLEPGTTLYWTNGGTSQVSDFLGYVNNGSVILGGTYTAGEASVIITPLMDVATEGSETIIFQVRTGGVAGPIVAVAETVTINDISVVPSYNIAPRVTSISEGSSITYDVTTAGIAGGTTLYWTNSGTTQPSDFLVQTNSGSTLLGGDYTNGFATIKLDTVRSPGVTAIKSIVIQLRTDSITGTIVKTANVVYVTDAPDPTYLVSARNLGYDSATSAGGSLSVTESDSIRFDIMTFGVQGNTTLFYNVTGTSSSSDYTSLLTWGTVKTVGSEFGACANVIVDFVQDFLTEGPETLIFNVYATRTFDEASFLAGPITLNINDTTVAPAVTITPSSLNINEGQPVTITLDTDGIRPGNVVYWRNLGTTSSSDFDGLPGSTIPITGSYRAGVGTITFTLAEDYTPNLDVDPGSTEEGPETIIFAVYLTDPNVGSPAPLAAPVTITVADTSKVTTTSTTTLSPAAVPPPGAALVNFFNGGFEIFNPQTTDGDGVDHIPGWSIYKPGVGNTPAQLRLNGFSNILGWPTPNDPTPTYLEASSPYGDERPVSLNFSWSIENDVVPPFGGQTVLRLLSSGTSAPYGIGYGPYMVADNPIICEVGDKVFFSWKAQSGADDFDVFAYLLDVSNGKTVLLLNTSASEYGNTTTPWNRVEKIIGPGETGTFRFVFICGTYDASGGTALGASLYLDNIDKISAEPPPWSITVTPPTTKVGGNSFTFNWTGPAEAVGTTQGWFIVDTDTSTAFSGTGITGANLGATDNLPTNSTSGSIVVDTNEILGFDQTFQLIITNGPLNGTVLARSPICTIKPPL